MSYIEIPGGRAPIRAWVAGVELEQAAEQQLRNIACLPFVDGVAVMPDVHFGRGATVGSVIAMRRALVPAAVGVDIGCGMMAVETNVTASQLPDNLKPLRLEIEKTIPVGQASHSEAPRRASHVWRDNLGPHFAWIEEKWPAIVGRAAPVRQLGTLGGGNHFIELCLDQRDDVWVMLHSGSRNIGNRIGQHFIALARKRCEKDGIGLPDRDLAWLPQGTPEFDDYVAAVSWAQDYAAANRRLMMDDVFAALRKHIPHIVATNLAVNCHHNYVDLVGDDGDLWITRKGAVSARAGELGIIPGSMGAKSFIVSGKGNPDSYHSCSHGAGRRMSRTAAKRMITLDDHIAATDGIECRKDEGVIDESPAAYKDIDAVMAAQSDLVDVVRTLHQVLCVKG